jgi:hypothetical protein
MLERRNPVPPGRYWLDVFPPNIATVTAWTRGNKTVRVVSSEFFDTTPPRQWLMFDITEPTQFDQLTFGFPTVVKQASSVAKDGKPIDTKVKTSADTADLGKDASIFDELSRGLGLSPELAALVPLVALGIAALVVTSVINNRK